MLLLKSIIEFNGLTKYANNNIEPDLKVKQIVKQQISRYTILNIIYLFYYVKSYREIFEDRSSSISD